MSLRDLYGNPLSSTSRTAVDAYDRGVRGLLGFSADIIDSFRAALEADPEFVLARAALAVSLYLAEKIPEGRAEMDKAAAAAATLPLRERRHVEALALWVAGRANDAIPLIKEILIEHPRDMLLMQRLYYIYFWQGRSAAMLELTQSVLHALDADGFMLGYHAFALEENRRFDEALPLAERAIAMNPRDAWAVHAVAHVLYERGENALGVDALPLRIHPCDHLGYFRNHLLWHLALMHLAEGRYDRVEKLFDGVFGDIPITVGSDLQDSVALAWRLDLYGRPDPERWKRLGVAARGWLEMPLLLFHDLHVGMALAASGDWAAAEMQLGRLRERGKKSRHPTLPDVVVPLMEGLHAFVRGEHPEAIAKIAPLEERIIEVGGSHAQREVFHDTLLEAALRAGEPERARPLLERRLAKRPNPGRHWIEARG
ncbi:MAG TPA: tetratricopeptide repeat protein [Terriglobales bacterium]|nr:tetratricopeptide repeat protein [Terriglobales bacterium]